ncbi:hypothetical protein GE09DRAFT_972809 [Coniochaeta sp. 2T2.1]|nr:hypothetical protein GE09DRAFT_972809 [Coniochaeta sp. 2T2.1]
MGGARQCVPCRAAGIKCDRARPKCTRCLQQGLVCSGLPLESFLAFRNENEVAKRNSQRVKKQQQPSFRIHRVLGSTTGSTSSPSSDSSLQSKPESRTSNASTTGAADSLKHGYWSFNNSTNVKVPEPLKRDVEIRAVERFFVNWTVCPSKEGSSPGYMWELPTLFSNAKKGSVLWHAVRAVAFADMKGESRDSVPYHLKARQHYGAALSCMRTVIADQTELGTDSIMTAILLIDNFELMYLGRNDPHSAHTEAIRHVLHKRTTGEHNTSTRFSLWRVTHYRLIAWQTQHREHPYAQQLEWLRTLKMDRADFWICVHVLHMNSLSALSKTLTSSSTGGDQKARLDKLAWARQLASEMQELTVSVESYASGMARAWNASEEDLGGCSPTEEANGSPTLPMPQFPYPRLLKYDDIWLAYIWNFFAASQLVLRESLVEVMEYIDILEDESTANDSRFEVTQKQREWIDVLSAAILKSLPQLLGIVSKHKSIESAEDSEQGKMAGRLFALFSMWVIQGSKYAALKHKNTASEVIDWINNRHELSLS